MANILEPIEEY